MKRILPGLLMMILCLVLFAPQTAEAAVKISKTKATLEADATLTLKIIGTEEKVTWSTSDKTVATVSKSGKITAKKEGQTTITATVSNKKYTCDVTVVDSNKKNFNKDLTVGEYLVGDDIKAGKYDLKGVQGWGIIYVYSNEKDYIDDKLWKKSINLCGPDTEDALSSLYTTGYKNLTLRKGEYVVIGNALTVNFKSK